MHRLQPRRPRLSGPTAPPGRLPALLTLLCLTAGGCGGGGTADSGGAGGVGGAPSGGVTTDAGPQGGASGGDSQGGALAGAQSDAGPAGGTTGGASADLGPGGTVADAATPSPDAAPPGDPNVLVGAFQVLLTAAAEATEFTPAVTAQTSIVGRVQDGPTPELIVWSERAAADGCHLLVPRVPFCSVSCGGSAACVEDETCQAYPTAQDVGTVTVTGIATAEGETTFTLSPVAATYQRSGLPFPAFEEGAAIRFESSGGAYRPFTLDTTGIAPLTLTNAPMRLADGEAATLTWTPAATPDATSVLVRLDISHHGGTVGKMECEVPDSGELTLPSALVSDLLALGTAGFPTVVVTRRAVGRTVLAPGRVELQIVSTVEQTVEIPGLVSCTSDEECADGQTCQPNLTCQ